MPAASSNSIRKCTETIAHHVASSLDVCRAGDRVAIHVHTPSGVVHVLVAEAEFVAKCRGRVDINGNPWRVIDGTKRATIEQLENDAAAAPSCGETEHHSSPRPYTPHGVFAQAAAQAWEDLKADPSQRIEDVADRCGLNRNSFTNWVAKHHPGELPQLRAAIGLNRLGRPIEKDPILKPKGAIL